MKTVRCAIYTRKSSEEGLDQAFNSLDAQREACAAYILSQASEGWTALPDIYDDGGLSGGTLDRPALQRLLAEVAGGRVDIIVVYKVDRLTRSLLDFSKLVESFDKAGTSFVSVTQSFNTTTSMGRLTLNMLLSFAQFEREVTAERIRDKIAASKAKGMWMGGTPPLGYEPDGRSLKIVEEHAALIRDIFDRYLRLGNVRYVAEELECDEVRSPVRTSIGGKTFGGAFFARGQIYGILKCPTYVGEVHHRGSVYPGLHTRIVDRETWDRTQATLAGNLRGHRSGERAASPSLLAGKIVDGAGRPLIPVHATKGKTRYRYYVSRDLQDGTTSIGLRIPAAEIEAAVRMRIGAIFDDGFALATTDWLQVSPGDYATLTERCSDIAGRSRGMVRDLLQQVRICDGRIEIDCSTAAIAEALGVQRDDDAPDRHTVISDVRLTRSGRAMRLIQENGAAIASSPNASLIRLIIKARRWWARLRVGDVDIKTLGKIEGVQAAYITRVVRLAFLSPAVVEGILAGNTLPGVDATSLTLGYEPAPAWRDQEVAILPRPVR
jgi:DNA invertase Pin-like site-specific DNA recombinase